MRSALERAKGRPVGAALTAGGLATASMTLAVVGLAGSAQAAVPTEVNENIDTCAEAGLPGSGIILDGGPQSESNDFAVGTISNKGTPNHDLLDVELLDESLEITGVAIRGGSQEGTNRWWVWKGEPYTEMTAPDIPGDDRPIVEWFVCATEKATPPVTETVTPPEKTVTLPPETVTQAPPAAKPPVVLPTAVPAGVEGSGDSAPPWAAAGLLAGLAMTGAGAWVLSRRTG